MLARLAVKVHQAQSFAEKYFYYVQEVTFLVFLGVKTGLLDPEIGVLEATGAGIFSCRLEPIVNRRCPASSAACKILIHAEPQATRPQRLDH